MTNPPPVHTRTTLGSAHSRNNAFDTIRLLAATAVLVSHSFALTGYVEPLEETTGGVTLGTLAVGAFFVISGLLITTSAERRMPRRFAAHGPHGYCRRWWSASRLASCLAPR
jgi:peptidoglycan/LPS O-acetylase OafA/YrhL